MTATLAPPKPRLRGWLHLGAFPFALVSGLFLTANGTTHADRIAIAVFTLTACLLFGTSAVYHRGAWSPRTAGVLRRLDHSNIALIIAGTYTPIAVAVLPASQATVLLWIVWSTALAIVVFRVAWLSAPRWLYTAMYIGLGWAAVFWLPEMWHLAGVVNILLVAAGGLLYTAGAVCYALRRPALSPSTFGYHELFHACTIAAFTCHLVVVARVAT
ncbi:MAG TPA: hemolysin III family protein [Acidimicrobiales bacterium]